MKTERVCLLKGRKPAPAWWVVILYSLVIFSAACSSASDPGLLDPGDGDLDTDRDRDREIVTEAEYDPDTDPEIGEEGDPDPEFDIEKKPDGDVEESGDPDRDPEIEADGDFEPDSDPEIEADGDLESDLDHDLEPERDPDPDMEPDLDPDPDPDPDQELGSISGKIVTREDYIGHRYSVVVYTQAVDTAVIPYEEPFAVARLATPNEIVYSIDYVIHNLPGGDYYLYSGVDSCLNDEGDEFHLWSAYPSNPLNINLSGQKDLTDRNVDFSGTAILCPRFGECQGDEGNEVGVGKVCTKGGGECAEGLTCFKDINIDAPGFCTIITCTGHAICGSGSMCAPIVEGEYCLPISCLETLDSFCKADEGNDVGVGKACSLGGGECPQGTICGLESDMLLPPFCTILDCTSTAMCGTDAECQPVAEEGRLICVPSRCLDDSPEGSCLGDEGNDIGIGRACSQGIGECPEGTVCGLDFDEDWHAICTIIDCTSNASCGSDAACQPIVGQQYLACLPRRCIEEEEVCIGDELGNNYGVGAACTTGGEECRFVSQCLSDYYPGAPSICTYIDCAENWMCGEDAFCIQGEAYTACLPERCVEKRLPDCQPDEGNETGVGSPCSLGGGECPFPTLCLVDILEDAPPICSILDCTSDEQCGTGATCFSEDDFGVCTPDRCLDEITCSGITENAIGIGRACTAGGGECPAGAACMADRYPGAWDICVKVGCASHSDCGSEAVCMLEIHHMEHLCVPIICLGSDALGPLCIGDIGNELGIGKSCTAGGGECLPDNVCLRDLNDKSPEICSFMECSADEICGTAAVCVPGEAGAYCLPERCSSGIPPCEGDEGNELGVGKACTAWGGECPDGAYCLTEFNNEDQAPEICITINCEAHADCGTGAICMDAGQLNICVPQRCIPEY